MLPVVNFAEGNVAPNGSGPNGSFCRIKDGQLITPDVGTYHFYIMTNINICTNTRQQCLKAPWSNLIIDYIGCYVNFVYYYYYYYYY